MFIKRTAILIVLGLLTLTANAETTGWQASPKNSGFSLAVPAYLYAQNSTYGIQAGYQFKKAFTRIDINIAEDYRNKEISWALMPSVGIFYTQDWQETIRFYEGLTFGLEKGLVHSFNGIIGFVNYIAGAEFLAFRKKTFFIEVGSGMAFSQKDGAYNGGTIVGGGFKYYFNRRGL